jgi:hypothetical protein
VIVLGLMARSNRRAGWRRERTDFFTDALMRWSAETYHAHLPQTRTPRSAEVTSDLVALQAMIGTASNTADLHRGSAPSGLADAAGENTPMAEKTLRH